MWYTGRVLWGITGSERQNRIDCQTILMVETVPSIREGNSHSLNYDVTINGSQMIEANDIY